jgi:polyphosphate glucokinase
VRGACTLAIDIGGTGIKMLVLDAAGNPLTERARELTPDPAEPERLLEVVRGMVAKMPKFDRVSVGFPGVVRVGVVHTAPNLGTKLWQGFDLGKAIAKHTKKPVRVLNDCDLQGYGVIEGAGVELVLTLGTGLGSALFVNGHLVPNLELGHHPFQKGETYEERVSNAELEKIGKKRWSARVTRAIATLEPIFNYDRLWIGGGNAKKLRLELPQNAKLFDNVVGLSGGTRLWQDR